jgi:hypothetical protein
VLRVLYVPTTSQFADVFTKGLPSSVFVAFRSSLNVLPIDVPTAGGRGGVRLVIYYPRLFYCSTVFALLFNCICFTALPIGLPLLSYICKPPVQRLIKHSKPVGFPIVLGGIFSIPLDLASFGGQNHGYGLLMRCSYYPQSLVQVHVAIREIEGWMWRGLAGAVHPELPRLHRSDRCKSPVGFASGELLDSCVFGSWCCWSVLGLFGVVLLGFV